MVTTLSALNQPVLLVGELHRSTVETIANQLGTEVLNLVIDNGILREPVDGEETIPVKITSRHRALARDFLNESIGN